VVAPGRGSKAALLSHSSSSFRRLYVALLPLLRLQRWYASAPQFPSLSVPRFYSAMQYTSPLPNPNTLPSLCVFSPRRSSSRTRPRPTSRGSRSSTNAAEVRLVFSWEMFFFEHWTGFCYGDCCLGFGVL
jgi:hypothetical protein